MPNPIKIPTSYLNKIKKLKTNTKRNPNKAGFGNHIKVFETINLLEVAFCLNANPQLPAPLSIFADDPHSDATNNLQYNKIVGLKANVIETYPQQDTETMK